MFSESRKGHLTLKIELHMFACVPGTEPGSSEKAANIFNCRTLLAEAHPHLKN